MKKIECNLQPIAELLFQICSNDGGSFLQYRAVLRLNTNSHYPIREGYNNRALFEMDVCIYLYSHREVNILAKHKHGTAARCSTYANRSHAKFALNALKLTFQKQSSMAAALGKNKPAKSLSVLINWERIA